MQVETRLTFSPYHCDCQAESYRSCVLAGRPRRSLSMRRSGLLANFCPPTVPPPRCAFPPLCMSPPLMSVVRLQRESCFASTTPSHCPPSQQALVDRHEACMSDRDLYRQKFDRTYERSNRPVRPTARPTDRPTDPTGAYPRFQVAHAQPRI